jgi:hypothetical protein
MTPNSCFIDASGKESPPHAYTREDTIVDVAVNQ